MTAPRGKLKSLANSLGDKARCQKWMEIALALCTHAVNGESIKAEVGKISTETCIHVLTLSLVAVIPLL
jgi:hypothetical protein